MKSNGIQKVAVYLRVSTLNQAKGETSQQHAIQRYLSGHDIKNAKWFFMTVHGGDPGRGSMFKFSGFRSLRRGRRSYIFRSFAALRMTLLRGHGTRQNHPQARGLTWRCHPLAQDDITNCYMLNAIRFQGVGFENVLWWIHCIGNGGRGARGKFNKDEGWSK